MLLERLYANRCSTVSRDGFSRTKFGRQALIHGRHTIEQGCCGWDPSSNRAYTTFHSRCPITGSKCHHSPAFSQSTPAFSDPYLHDVTGHVSRSFGPIAPPGPDATQVAGFLLTGAFSYDFPSTTYSRPIDLTDVQTTVTRMPLVLCLRLRSDFPTLGLYLGFASDLSRSYTKPSQPSRP